MNEEFTAFMQNDTYTLVPPTTKMNLIGCKWVFKIKHRADGSLKRLKAHLVAEEHYQQEGLDYGKTYSPVFKPITIHLTLSIAISSN